jgi:hypothetical protein
MAEPSETPGRQSIWRPVVVRRIMDAERRERQAVVAEIVRIHGLMPLLMKHRNGSRWSSQERSELLEQMRALAHLSPYLFVLVLPGSFVALPLLAWWLDRRRQRRSPERVVKKTP